MNRWGVHPTYSSHPPLSGVIAVLYRDVYEPPRPLGEVVPELPPAICDVVMRAIATNPVDRYPTAKAPRTSSRDNAARSQAERIWRRRSTAAHWRR